MKSLQVHWDRGYFPSQPLVFRRRFIYVSGLVIQEVCDEVISALSDIVDYDDLRAYQEYTTNGHRLIITHIGSGSAAEEMGVSLGDLITQVNDHRVQSLEALQKALNHEKKSGARTVLIEFASGAFASIETQSYTEEETSIRKLSSKLFQRVRVQNQLGIKPGRR